MGTPTSTTAGRSPGTGTQRASSASSRPSRRRLPSTLKLVLRLALVVVTLVVGVGLFTARLFVWPPTSGLGRADAVVVLSGDHGERLSRALRLIGEGVSSVLVLAGEPDSLAARELCAGGKPFEVVCLQPNPDNTREEARAAGQLARARSWKTVLVVTSTQHVTRAGLLFDRCVDGKVGTVPARPGFGLRVTTELIVREWLGLIRALGVHRGC